MWVSSVRKPKTALNPEHATLLHNSKL